MKHTPGPWMVDAMGNVWASNTKVCDMAERPIQDSAYRAKELGEHEANARLIAAAPDLLEALKDMTPPMPPPDAKCHFGLVPQSECAYCKRIAKAHAAIAKATGE